MDGCPVDYELAGVMMLDLSAAFDLVDRTLLLEKLQCMGFEQKVLMWFRSYLSERNQCVYIDGQCSQFLQVDTGVPQGSVLGALMYILFVNELPEVVNDHTECSLHNRVAAGSFQSENGYRCMEYGSLCCYVDDSTLTVTNKDPVELSTKLSENYRKLSEFFGDNRLILNEGKTRLIAMCPHRMALYR